MYRVSAVLIAFNQETRLRQTLKPVGWCAEIVIIDSGSTDKTLEICKEYSLCIVFMQPFLGEGVQKKFVVEKASFD